MNKSFRDAMMEMMMQGQGGQQPPQQPLVDQGQFNPGPLPTFPKKKEDGGVSEMLDPATAMKLAEMFGSFMG